MLIPGMPAPAPCAPMPIGATPPIAAPPIGAAPAVPIGCAYCDREPRACDRKPAAKSRSLPDRSSRPASRARKPRSRGAAIRSSIVVTTCSAVARLKRAKSAAGIRSAFSIVPVASPSARYAPEAFDSVSVSVSSPSSCASSNTETSIVFDESPAWNESVPLAAV